MMTAMSALLGNFLLLFMATPVFAHHSLNMVTSKSGWVSSARDLFMMRAALILAGLLGMVSMPGAAIAQELDLAINFVAVSDRLHTAGQPDEAHLSSLASRGYGLVINIAPPTSRGSIATEGKLVAEAGIAYVNIPVDWQHPQYTDFELFSGVMQQAGARRVLVHCQMNMRASLFTFLYRVVHEQADPQEAYGFVTKVWEPKDQWLTFAQQVLNKNNIQFEISEK